MNIAFWSTAILQIAFVSAEPLYKLTDASGPGTITLTATKVYNMWNNYGNSTKYTVQLVSPYINSTSQEIRVAIQWQWLNKLGVSNERVAFYGEVSKQRFDEFRIDTHMQVNGSYLFENWFFPVVPKDSYILPPQDPNDAQKYILTMPDYSEISPDNNTATFTFTVNRDEPYSDNNLVWINWGVFESPNESDLDKVYGSKDPLETEMWLGYSDYYDRVLINYIYLTLALVGSVSFWAALPLQIVPMIVILLYVFYQPVSILFTVPNSQNFTFNNYVLEVILKWQSGTVFVLSSMIFGDLLTYIPLGFFAFQLTQNEYTVSTTDFIIFYVSIVISWICQWSLHIFPALIAIVYFDE